MTTVTSSDLRMAEFLSLYKRCIAVKKLSDNSAKWFPKWFESYVRFHRFHTKESVEKIPVTEELLIGFLRHLRDSKVPAWQRLQAAQAIEAYENLVLRSGAAYFEPIRNKLTEIANRERSDQYQFGVSNLVAGEGNVGLIEDDDVAFESCWIAQQIVRFHASWLRGKTRFLFPRSWTVAKSLKYRPGKPVGLKTKDS